MAKQGKLSKKQRDNGSDGQPKKSKKKRQAAAEEVSATDDDAEANWLPDNGPDDGDADVEGEDAADGLETGSEGGPWWEVVPPPPQTATETRDPAVVEQMTDLAEKYQAEAVEAHTAKRQRGKSSSDAKWLETVLRSGTTADRVAAMTVLVQEAPGENLQSLQSLLTLASKKGGAREGRTMALDALKELMLQNLLPTDRKLEFFKHRPLAGLNLNKPATRLLLRGWLFEDALKRCYVDFLAVLERDLADTVTPFRLKALHTVAEMLTAKPEQEAVLLALLVRGEDCCSRRINQTCPTQHGY